VNPAISPPPAPALPNDRPVLANAPLRPGFDRADLSCYGDARWDLGPAVFRENARCADITVDFESIGDPIIAEAIREYLYARLNIDLPGYKARALPVTVRSLFRRAFRFFNFVKIEHGICDLGRIDQALLDRYAKVLQNGRRPVVVMQVLGIVFDLYAFRQYLPTAALRFEPWPGRTLSQVAGYRFIAEENRTPHVPENIIAPLLAWSLKYVTVFAPDILAARSELTQLEERRVILAAEDATSPRSERRARRRARVVAYLDERRRQGRGVPVWAVHIGKSRRVPPGAIAAPPINWQLLHQKTGLDANIQKKLSLQATADIPDLVTAAVNEIGIEVGGMDTPISVDPDTGRPWRPHFDARALVLEERLLQAACYVVCAYLTGMRDCEVQAMRPGCLSITRSEDGVIERHRVRSVVYKGKAAQGERAAWITIAPVATAISVLEQLVARSAARRGTETLWPVLGLARARKQCVSTEIVAHLNEFRDHLNARFGTEDAPIVPAGPSGAPWRFSTRQFRRTIAWHIANRPFGTIAGMIQYKHASVAAFEGYAGSSRSGFRAEVEAERRLGQIEDILTYFDDRPAGARLSGPAAARVGQALDAAAAELQPLPGMIADRGRLRVLLADTARTLHVGVLADCFFDPATAVCLRRATASDRTAPMISLCEPTRCPNACVTRRHRPAWERTADDTRALLKEKRLSGLQRTALTQELHRIETILAAVEYQDAPVTVVACNHRAAGRAIIADLGSRSVRLSGVSGSRSVILGSR
jgi:hypothetical protein